jgi:uncharacterized membrane protein (DUF373 family)
MRWTISKNNLILKFEAAVVAALRLLLILVIAVAACVLFLLFLTKLRDEFREIDSLDSFLPATQRWFAGILVVLLGLELLETLKVYFTEHHVRLEVILVVAIIAVCRQVIQIDLEHASGPVLLGFSAVIASLTVGYFLVRRI